MQVQQKPNVALFVDIDGVLVNDIAPEIERFRQIAKDLLDSGQSHVHKKLVPVNCNLCSTAKAHLFNKEAVEALDDLIGKIEEVANVHIIISSMWRLRRTVEELKQIFHMHAFSKYIIDKTDDEYLSIGEANAYCQVVHLEPTASNYRGECAVSCKPINEEGFANFKVEQLCCRASQINKWIEAHPGYAAFGIFDDIDEHLSATFEEKFISTATTQILTPEHTNQAYVVIAEQLAFHNRLKF